MKKDKNFIKNLILCIVSFMSIIIIFVIGMLFIKDAADEIGLMEKGYRNLCQVNVYAGIKNGRGIIIDTTDDYIDIVTSKHLVSEENNVSIEFGNKGKVDAEVVYYYSNTDAAIIRVMREDSDFYIKGAKAPEIMSKSDYESYSLSSKVYFANNIYDVSLDVAEGLWISSDEFVYELSEDVGLFSGEVLPGMSGEGVFDEDDRLIGMIIAANETEGAVIPAYELRNEYMTFLIAK
ncbi:Trypsin-like peptidase domain-containing protein [Lachnospiraceae bacterium G41]|nr:Trypsin-like peptidase domain-containing protein [Lachnospiraceae bacterium G41]